MPDGVEDEKRNKGSRVVSAVLSVCATAGFKADFRVFGTFTC